MQTGELLTQLQCHSRAVNALVLVGTDVWSASDDRSIRVIDAEVINSICLTYFILIN